MIKPSHSPPTPTLAEQKDMEAIRYPDIIDPLI
jgi:hypothetical protein